MGVIIDGKYYPDKKHVPAQVSTTLKDAHEQGVLRKEYQNHAHNLIQPHNQDGTPNDDFVDYFPEDAKEYGFIPESEE